MQRLLWPRPRTVLCFRVTSLGSFHVHTPRGWRALAILSAAPPHAHRYSLMCISQAQYEAYVYTFSLTLSVYMFECLPMSVDRKGEREVGSRLPTFFFGLGPFTHWRVSAALKLPSPPYPSLPVLFSRPVPVFTPSPSALFPQSASFSKVIVRRNTHTQASPAGGCNPPVEADHRRWALFGRMLVRRGLGP